jgi:regulator of protease activity HflC (stomatin/prohibitin superfamily)
MSSQSQGQRPYDGILLMLFSATVLGAFSSTVVGHALGDPMLLVVAAALVLASGILAGSRRGRDLPTDGQNKVSLRLAGRLLTQTWIIAGVLLLISLIWQPVASETSALSSLTKTAVLAAAAWLASAGARYFGQSDAEKLNDARNLTHGSRVLVWVLIGGALSGILPMAGARPWLYLVQWAVVLLVGAVCVELGRASVLRARGKAAPTTLTTLEVFGGRPNLFASVLDAFQDRLQIDLRSTWAIQLVRQSMEPLALGLVVIGWLTTAFTVVGVSDQGLVERLGVPLASPPLEPGLHVHWPWPVDRVILLPVRKIASLRVGHEEEEPESLEQGAKAGTAEDHEASFTPEDILWARQHADSEYTLVLGDGRDLIAVDAVLQYRITDARAWYYNCGNPEALLKAVAYRAVMRITVDRTLEQALSENVSVQASRVREMIEEEAKSLGLGVEVVAFNIAAMHPPAGVARDYQAVVSAELARTTSIIKARANQNEILPKAESEALEKTNQAQAEAVEAEARAGGEAFEFATLRAEYRANPQALRFRKRSEGLEKALQGKSYTVLDHRVQRDGGDLWLVK